MVAIRVLAVVALVASCTNAYVGSRISSCTDRERRRLYVSIHISSGIVLCVNAALLAFWAFTSSDW
jgi:heme/copper-type cytochrome/quinol oxidase subunit 2